MDFWQNSGLKYEDLVDLQQDKLILLINGMNRQDIIAWLSWNDRNGIYQDEHSLKELGNVMTREEGIEILLRQLEDNRVP